MKVLFLILALMTFLYSQSGGTMTGGGVGKINYTPPDVTPPSTPTYTTQ